MTKPLNCMKFWWFSGSISTLVKGLCAIHLWGLSPPTPWKCHYSRDIFQSYIAPYILSCTLDIKLADGIHF